VLRRVRFRSNVALLAAATGAAAFAAPAVASTVDSGPPPASLAALGDSVSRGYNACGFYVDCTSQSWSAGDSTQVDSHYLRILHANAAISGHNLNDAQSGAVAADLPAQARRAVAQHAAYVTVQIGANDACRDHEAQMTPVREYRAAVDSALDILNAGLPSARIFVASIPDLKRLWEVERGDLAARVVWAVAGICQTMLADPTSTAPADTARRDRIRQRVVDYNTALAQSCAAHRHCRFDGGAVFGVRFTARQVSGWDHFHPNAAGQALMARVTYEAGFNW
jgi:lysophospholipase L1-like esterase